MLSPTAHPDVMTSCSAKSSKNGNQPPKKGGECVIRKNFRFEPSDLKTGNLDKNDNLRNPLKTPSAENAISAIKLFAFLAKILAIKLVLPSIL
ncbi:hypothetical protein TNCV_1959871 [Trichonephila clavipes]|nr:hypothetical protein TNCV_1959871 [Trichonephila clavipes]